MKYLNIGCGNRFHDEWDNVDSRPASNNIRFVNLLDGLPYQDETFNLVYHSHVLEHFSKKNGDFVVRECFRVLKSGGIIRIVVPDLQQWVNAYVDIIKSLNDNSSKYSYDHEWLMIELFDQFSRDCSGGMMSEFMRNDKLSNYEFVKSRVGAELINQTRKYSTNNYVNHDRMAEASKWSNARKIWNSLLKVNYIKEYLIKILLGSEYNILKHGRFYDGGEMHKWMYDKYSLSKLLLDKGFKNITVRTPAESFLESWSQWNLDTNPDGSVYQPNSLYIEAIKQ